MTTIKIGSEVAEHILAFIDDSMDEDCSIAEEYGLTTDDLDRMVEAVNVAASSGGCVTFCENQAEFVRDMALDAARHEDNNAEDCCDEWSKAAKRNARILRKLAKSLG